MSCVLFGAPGAGKGTQSALLVERQKMFHISTGDLFRHAIKSQTELGLKAKSYMDAGNLVPDEVVMGMVEEVFAQLKGRAFVLDGFPRTVHQAEALEVLLAKYGLKLKSAVFLDVAEEKIVRRLTGRRVCRNCGAVYHMESFPPKKADVCDSCGAAALYQRDDDKEEVIRVRLANYEKSTAPLRSYFRDKGIYHEISGDGKTEEVYARLAPLV